MKFSIFKRFAIGFGAGLALLTALAWQLDPNTRYFIRVSVSQTNSVNEQVVTNGLTIGGIRNTAWPPTTNFPPSTDLNFGGKAATNISDITVTGSITINGIQYTTTTNFPPSTDLDFNNKSATNVAAVVLPGGDVQSQLNGKQSSLTFDNGVTNDNGVVNGAFDAGSNVTLTTNSHRIVISAAGGGAGGIPDPGANGLVVRTALNTSAATTILGSSSDIDVANGNGVSSNPTISSSDLVTAGTSAKVTFNAKGKITGTNTLTTAEIQSALGQVYQSTNSTLTEASTNNFVGTGRIPLENEIPALQTNVAAANPTATVATTAVNGTASTFMRSDAAPAIPAAFIQSNQTNVAAANPTATVATTAVNGTAATFMRSDASPAIPAAFIQANQTNVAAANPTATVSTTAVNGTAETFMRSDASPAIPASFIQANQTNVAAANPTATVATTAVNGTAATFMRSDASPAIPAAFIQSNQTNVAGANPTATASGTVNNGTAATFMRSDASPAIATTTITDSAGIGAGSTLTIGTGYTVSSSTATPTFGSVTAAFKAKGPIFDIVAYGADGSGTTTTISSWSDSQHFVVASAASFANGQAIAIDRAGGPETTGNTSAGSGTISSVASTNGFAINDYIRVIGGRAAQAMARTITCKVAGNAGDVVSSRINSTNYNYTLGSGDSVTDVATRLGAAIAADTSVVITTNLGVITITAAVAGTPFTYENVRPIAANPYENVRSKLIYETTAANIPTTDFVTKITGATATSFTVSPVVPSALTGTRIEKYANRLVTTISGLSGTSVTIADAATSQPTSVAVYHDSATALSSAKTAAAAVGGIVYAPAGHYYLGNLLTGIAMANTGIVGDGMGVSVIHCPGWCVGTKLGWQTSSGTVSNLLLRDFTVDLGVNPYIGQTGTALKIGTFANNTTHTNILIQKVQVVNSGYGISIYNANSTAVDHCHFQNMGDTAVFFGLYDNLSSVTDTRVYNLWLTDSVFDQCARFGAVFYCDSATAGSYTTGRMNGVHTKGNTFRQCGLCGCEYYTGVVNGELISNVAEYCGGKETMWSNGAVNDHGGLTVKYSRNVVFSHNEARNCWRAYEVFGRTNDIALGYMTSQDISIVGNVASDCYQGINHTTGTVGLDISDNVFDTMQDAGITSGGNDTTAWPCLRTRIHGNAVRNCYTGILVGADSVDTEVSYNILDSNNTFELNSAPCSAVYVGVSNGTHPCTNVMVLRNRMIETRVLPSFAQMYAVYGDYAKYLKLVGNSATNNQNNTYSVTANATVMQSTMNTWDTEGFEAVTATGTGTLARQISPAFTAPTVTGRTWATINATTPTAGTIDFATDLGVGTHVTYVGSRWKPMNGRSTLAALGNPVTGVANSETIVLQALIPAGVWQVNDVVRINADITKSGTTDTGVVSVRIGTAGTTGDTIVINGATFIAAGNRAWTGFLDFKELSATSIQKVGSGAANSTGVGTSSVAEQAATTVSSAASNALYISLTIKSSSTSDTVGLSSGFIELLTP